MIVGEGVFDKEKVTLYYILKRGVSFMKFSCGKDVFLEAVLTTSKAASPKSTIPALEGILLELENNSLTLTGYNLEIGIRTVIPVANGENGSVVINAKTLSDFVRKMPSGDLEIVVESNNSASIKNGRTKMSIMCLSAEDYPAVPQASIENGIVMKQKLLKSMIVQTKYACAVVDTKPVLTGCLFEIKDNVLSVVGMDGLRIAVRQEPLTFEDTKMIVPAKSLEELSRLLSDGDDDVTVSIERNQVSFRFGKYTMISRIINGDFFDFHKHIQSDSTNSIEISCSQMIETLERGMLVISEKVKLPLRCEFSADTLKLSCVTALGSYEDQINVKYSGEPFTIGLNTKFLLDAFKASECSDVRFVLTGKSIEPVLILPKEGQEFTFLIMPMRLK